jgi:UME (NUC010) domain
LKFLVNVAFSDSHPSVLEYSSRELGNVLSANGWSGFFALLSTNDEWQQLKRSESDSGMPGSSTLGIDQMVSRFFHYIDDILNELHSKAKLRAHMMVGTQDRDKMRKSRYSSESIEMLGRSAARALCSLCVNTCQSVYDVKGIIQNSIIRVIHLWSTFDATLHVDLSGLCFAELSRVSQYTDLGAKIQDEYWAAFAPMLFRDILLPTLPLQEHNAMEIFEKMSSDVKERQFHLLSSFIRTIVINVLSQNERPHLSSGGESDLERTVGSCLPFVISQFVVDKDYCGLQVTANYKLYILAENRAECKQRKRNGPLCFQNERVCGFIVGDTSKSFSPRQWNRDLENQTCQLCLAPGLIERITPLIFIKSCQDNLIFFTTKVLQNKITIKQLVTSREMLTLKNFVMELGRNPGLSDSVIVAMKRAAIARQFELVEINGESLFNGTSNASNDAVISWVTSNFMFLLVNVVQYKWSTKSISQRVASLRSLYSVLDFLHPSESSQYLPQIMATVNAALAEAPSALTPNPDRSLLVQLRLLAVQVLSKFVKSFARTQLEFLGQNLTSVVVSLVPIFTSSEYIRESKVVENECSRQGVALLEWLSGKEALSSYFADIPFLPPAPALDSVRASLRSRGVHFDNLHTVTTQGTQDAVLRGVASDSVSTGGDSRGTTADASRQVALRRRLETVCPLLENESASVRRVVLQHITALLRANRELFHALVENEGTTSLKRFLTVSYGDTSGTFIAGRDSLTFMFLPCSTYFYGFSHSFFSMEYY